jgi:hypothetical protein
VTIVEYLDSIKERLLTESVVSSFHVTRERVTLTDGSSLEFSEYVQCSPEGTIGVATYSYHWTDARGDLIRRWDNTPHFPALPGFPHHVHDGRAGTVDPGRPVSIFAVLDEIALLLA